MTKPTGRPKGRPPGRPKGSRDFRPHLLNLLERFKLIPVLLEELEALKDSLPPKEKAQLYLELARMGLAASPRTTEIEGGGPSIALYMNGVRQVHAVDGEPSRPELDVTPSPRGLPPAPLDDPRARAPYIPERTRPALAPEPPPVPRGTQVITVPRGPDKIPAEWRTPLYDFEE